MNPSTTDPDLKPLYDYRDTYDPAAPVADQINPPPDLNDPAVLVKLLKEYAQGMMMEAEAASGIGNQCGCSNPSFLFAQVAKVCTVAAKKIEATIVKPVEAPAEPAKTEPVKPGKK